MGREVIYILGVCLFFVMLESCKNKDETLDESRVLVKESDKKIKLSDIVSDSYIVRLETTDNNLIGQIDKIQLYKEKIFVQDRFRAKGILVFDINGKYLYRVGRVGKAPGEYRLPMDFTIDVENNKIIVLDDGGQLLYYDLDGKFIQTQKNNENIGINAFQNTKSGYAMIQGGGSANLLLVDKNFQEKKEYFPYLNRSIDRLIPNSLQIIADDVCLYRRNCNNVIYQITNNSIVTYKTIIFENGNIDYDDLTKDDNYLELQKRYNVIADFVGTRNSCFVLFGKKRKISFSFFEKNAKEALAYKYLNFENNISFDPKAYIVGSVGDYFIWQNSASQMLEVAEKLGKKDDELFVGLNNEDNPVLLFTKVKIDEK